MLLLRWVWYGYTFRRIKLANCDKYAIVDPCDFAELSRYTWLARHDGSNYIAIRLPALKSLERPVYMHRQIMELELNAKRSKLNVRLVIDHINGNPLDNRRANLRVVTMKQNSINRRKCKGCASVYKGVFWHKRIRKWNVQLTVNGRKIHLGYFDDELEAVKAYDAAAKKYHGQFACLNFPPPDKTGLKNLIKYWFSHRDRFFV